ncbi:DEAD/DEAH box helicase family protein [Arthrobacter sp. H35-D1]|uniref:DEAD/DEAH box helicase family protein n=1 Tax=Arthrobacter sp. H35-D1 TaxID=3046202 RepID=UPI0024B9E47F|nr:DEAD/DEAH box helicase family protein [Arthrobacter sp. H35-D1]MDJ0312026.1 DEAD/DEAH box helicase family protein [Arthrobacter sp. H35-D1]
MTHIDPMILSAAQKSVNFGLLLDVEPLLAVYGAGAEASLYTDPNGSLIKCRQLAEVLTEQLLLRSNTAVDSSKQIDRIQALAAAGVLGKDAIEDLHRIRKTGNQATHSHLFNANITLGVLHTCWELGTLLYRAVTKDRTVRTFLPPSPADLTPATAEDAASLHAIHDALDSSRDELAEALTVLDSSRTQAQAEAAARAKAEAELAAARTEQSDMAAKLEQLQAQLNELASSEPRLSRDVPKPTPAARQTFIDRATAPRPLSEVQARKNIDKMLRAAGWLVQDYRDIAPMAGMGVAVREFPLDSGFADYLLYVDSRLVGVLEAKKEGMSLTGVEWQTSKYATGLPASARLATWHPDTPLPFCYESTGAETRFMNLLDPDARSREVFSFHRPETLKRWMAEADTSPESPTLLARIQQLPVLEVDGLRPNQVQAVTGVETSLKGQHPRALIQMATGAGKTFTAVTSAYRLIRHANAGRILFLVDRNNLGIQAESEFVNFVNPDDGRRFGETYAVQRVAGRTIADSTNVAISTIQRLFRMLAGEDLPDSATENDENDDGEPESPVDVTYSAALPPETFDLIIVDECHRSIYGKWRAVLEYFDAPVVGLTATPTKQTLGFFNQNLVSEYPYEKSVADGVNVPFDVYRIKTQVTSQGATVEAGTIVPMRERATRRKRYEELEEDYSYTGKQLGRSVINKDQIRTVLSTFRDRLYTEIFPGRSYVPKTLIFAKDDSHADEIVQQVREVFGKGQDFAVKITYRSRSQGNDPQQLLQQFRNSPSIRVAVTVDMIATGTDVKAIECVFFMREVRSAVYFEQMKGRGSRTMDSDAYAQVTPDAKDGLTKDRFVIVDAVGVTESELVDADPMDRLPKSVSLQKLMEKAGALTITVDEVSTLAARLGRLATQLKPNEAAEIEHVSGGTSLRAIVQGLSAASDNDAVEQARESGDDAVAALIRTGVAPLASSAELRKRIMDIRRAKDIIFDEVNADELLSAAPVLDGNVAKSPIESWRDFIAENKDELAVLQLLHGSATARPTYAQLKELAEQVKRIPSIGSLDTIWSAYAALGEVAEPGHKPGVTDLVTILRHELGGGGTVDSAGAIARSGIRAYSSLVDERLVAWFARQQHAGVHFTDEQRWWIRRIAEVVKTSVTVELDDLTKTPFTERGGQFGFAQAFPSDALAIFEQLQHELAA